MDAQAEAHRSARLGAGIVVLLVAGQGAAYMVSQTLRNSIGVIAPDLAAELDLSPAEIGLLSSAFFISFAAAQLPLGVCLDRFGPKACMLACTGIVVLGALWFSAASTPLGLILARALIGLGCSCYLMAPLALYARRFPPERFAMLTGIQLGLGTIGTLFATAPLAFSAATVGWRLTFVLMAAAMAVAGLLLLLVVPGRQRSAAAGHGRESLRAGVAGTFAALRTPSVGRLFLMQLTAYSSFVLIVGLWGGPYLTHIYGYGLTERGDLLFVAAAGQALGLVISGPLERLCGGHKPPVLAGASLTAAGLLLLAVAGRLPAWALVIWLGAFGTFSAYTALLIAHGKTLFAPAIVGRGMTLLNIGTMGGVFLSQTLTGAIIEIFPPADGTYPLVAYRVVFVAQAACVILAMIPYVTAHEPRTNAEAPGATRT